MEDRQSPRTLDYEPPDAVDTLPWWIVLAAAIVIIASVVGCLTAVAIIRSELAGALILGLICLGYAMLEWGVLWRRESENCGPAIVGGSVLGVVFFVAAVADILDEFPNVGRRLWMHLALMAVAMFVAIAHLSWVQLRKQGISDSE